MAEKTKVVGFAYGDTILKCLSGECWDREGSGHHLRVGGALGQDRRRQDGIGDRC